jgi:iron complex outermembrane receptor protein
MQNKEITLGCLVSGFMMVALAPASAAELAAVPGASGIGGSDEIVVTARKRDESLQEVPIAITSLSGATIADSQISKMEGLTNRIPTLNIAVGGSGSGGQLSLRGIGSSNVSAAFDSAVALDFDGVIVSSMRIVQAGFFDVKQVDVLKGPQSLYFGKSATAGVLSIRSADPTSTFEVGLRGSYEFEEKGYAIEGYVSGPISETLGFRLAGRFNNIDRLYYNDAPNVRHPERGEKNTNVRATLEWQPSTDVSLNLKMNYVGHDSDGEIGHLQIYCGANGVPDVLRLLGGAVVVQPGYNCNAFDNHMWLPDAAPKLAVQGPPGMDQHNGVPFNNTDIYLARARLSAKLTEGLTATLVTGYFNFESRGQDFYGYGGTTGVGTDLNHNKIEQFTQEIRFSSDSKGPFNWMVGAFYEHRDILFEAAQNAVNIAFLARDPITGSSFDWRRLHFTKGDAYSGFASFTYEFAGALELSGGVRYTKEEKSNHIEVPYVHAALSAPPFNFIRSGFQSPLIKFTDDNWSPEVTLKYNISPDAQFYGAYKKGFKSGGIDNSALPSSGLSKIVQSGNYSSLMFGSETAEGFELGFKGMLADRRLRLNASAYTYNFSNLQLQSFDPVAIQYSTSNAGRLRSRGVDADILWMTPLEGLRLGASVAYTDTKFTKSYISNAGVDLNGRAAPRAPKWSGNISADWDILLSDRLKLGLTGLVNYSDSYFTDANSFNDYVQGSYATVDVGASIGSQNDSWKISLLANNVTDKIFVNTASGRPFQGPGGDDLALNQNRGRLVYLQGAVKF